MLSGDQTEQACRRGDVLEKRRQLMEEWALQGSEAKGTRLQMMLAPAAATLLIIAHLTAFVLSITIPCCRRTL